MHVGMTGTRDGMTQMQMVAFDALLKRMKADALHHGDCLGADSESHDIATRIGLITFVHPPEKDEMRAWKVGDYIAEEKNYFARNRDIVNQSEVLIGLPKTMFETKGGTWYTINYGKQGDKPVRIIYPDGSIEKFN